MDKPVHPGVPPKEQPTRRKPVRQSLEDNAPWKPARYELADVSAIQAVARGDASADQQKRALNWILYGACALRDNPYRPGAEDGRRDTDFALGKAHVGREVAKLMTADIAKLRRSEPLGDATEPKS